MEEIWKEHPSFNGRLLVSNLSRAKRSSISFMRNGVKVTFPERVLIPQAIEGCNGLYVGVCINKKKRVIRLDRAVADLFVDNPNNYKTLIHKNGDIADNRVDNLEWIDLSKAPDDGRVWRDIRGYEGRYMISSDGEVASLQFGQSKNRTAILKKILTTMGYYTVNLNQRPFFVHRLVADAFCEHPGGKDIVDHINTIPTDNRAENLRWVTIKENVNNPISAKRRCDAIRKLFEGKIGVDSYKHRGCLQMDLDGNPIKEWGCMSDAWREYGIDSGTLTKACQGKRATAGGFKWRYL